MDVFNVHWFKSQTIYKIYRGHKAVTVVTSMLPLHEPYDSIL